MNPNYTEFRFPQIKAHPWHKVFICQIMFLFTSIIHFTCRYCSCILVVHSPKCFQRALKNLFADHIENLSSECISY
jgi:hypothetical protein